MLIYGIGVEGMTQTVLVSWRAISVPYFVSRRIVYEKIRIVCRRNQPPGNCLRKTK
jgi:hypothetical protein